MLPTIHKDLILSKIPDDMKNQTWDLLVNSYPEVLLDVEDPWPVYYDNHNVIRWFPDPILDALMKANSVDLIKLCVAFQTGSLTPLIYRQFNKRIGYSLCGYLDLNHVQDFYRSIGFYSEDEEEDS